MLKAVLFDMDGVLFDSMRNHADSWFAVMHDRHGFECDRTLFYLYEGSTGAQTINDFFVKQRGREATEEEWRQIYKEKTAFFESLGEPSPMPGAAEVLKKVGEMGLTRVLVTGSGQASLIDRLQRVYPAVFDADHIVSAKDCAIGHGKPHPDPYLMGLKKAGNLNPHEAIVVENAPLGVRAGKAAGIFTIGVNTGPLDPQVLRDAGADVVLSSMTELFQNILPIASANWNLDAGNGD